MTELQTEAGQALREALDTALAEVTLDMFPMEQTGITDDDVDAFVLAVLAHPAILAVLAAHDPAP